MTSHRLTFITPLFSKGSYDDLPEIRPPSIRGQLHWWFRALGGNHTDEKGIFGGVHGGATASKVVVRVGNILGNTGLCATLPHKRGGQASEKAAFLPTTTFDLHLSERLGGITDTQRGAFRRTLEAWLLAGTLGLRATRACGSFTWHPLTDDAVAMPTTSDAYLAQLNEVFRGTPMRVQFLQKSFPTAEAARICVSDTIGGRDDREGADSLASINYPFGGIGRAVGGRKTSPLRFRIVKVGIAFHIIAVWDNRLNVTGNSQDDLDAVIQLLIGKNKRIGHLLQDAFSQ